MEYRTGIYLQKSQQQYFIRQLRDNCLIFERKILPSISGDINEESEEFFNNRLEGKKDKFFPDQYDGCIDEEDYFCNIEAEGYRYYEFLKDTKYRAIAMWICCTCQMWEQQLIRFIIQEMNNRDLGTKDKPKGWKDLKKIFEDCGIDIEKMACWEKILDLRALVNVLKHSEGDSEKRLRKRRPELFKINERDDLHMFHTTLGEVVLDIQEQDIKYYTDALIAFWENIPTNKWLGHEGQINCL